MKSNDKNRTLDLIWSNHWICNDWIFHWQILYSIRKSNDSENLFEHWTLWKRYSFHPHVTAMQDAQGHPIRIPDTGRVESRLVVGCPHVVSNTFRIYIYIHISCSYCFCWSLVAAKRAFLVSISEEIGEKKANWNTWIRNQLKKTCYQLLI